MAKTVKEVAEELRQILEGKLEKSVAANLSLEKELKAAQNKVANMEAKLKKKRKNFARQNC